MSRWTRRDLLRTTAASAAVAVPAVGAARQHRQFRLALAARFDRRRCRPTFDAADVTAAGPLMVCVHDAEGGDVSILHGTEEIVVNDRRLVAKIVRAKSGAKRA